MSTVYDSGGRRIWETNQDGIVTRFADDGAGRLTAVTNGYGAAQYTWATYQYDEAGNQTGQTNALGRATAFAYDSMGRRIARTMPGPQTEGFRFDVAGNLLAHTNFNGLIITNQYDVMNCLYKRFNGSTLLETYTYTPTGQITNRTDSTGTFTWIYDARDRVRTNFTPVGTLYSTWDANGNQLSLSSATSSGVSLTYQYDLLNRLTCYELNWRHIFLRTGIRRL